MEETTATSWIFGKDAFNFTIGERVERSIFSNKKTTDKGSRVASLKGNIEAGEVTEENINTQNQSTRGLTFGVESSAVRAVQSLQELAKNAERTDDPRF